MGEPLFIELIINEIAGGCSVAGINTKTPATAFSYYIILAQL